MTQLTRLHGRSDFVTAKVCGIPFRVACGPCRDGRFPFLGFGLRLLCFLAALAFVPFMHAQVPRIVDQPQSQNVTLNGMALFDVTVDPGSSNVRYQWRLNGGNVPGAIFRSLSLSNVQPAQAGLYSVVVYNEFGAVSSDGAELRLSSLPSIGFADAFADAPGFSGTAGLVRSDNFNATAEPGEPAHGGRPPRRTVWASWTAPASVGGIVRFRTAGTFDTVLAIYTGDLSRGLVSVRSDDDAGGFLGSEVSFRAQPQTSYRIVVDGLGGAQGSFLLDWKFETTLDVLPNFIAEPFDQSVMPGSEVALTVTGVTNYGWQWFFNGQPLPNETQTVLRIKGVGPADVGDYFCRGFSGERHRDTRVARLQISINELGTASPTSFTTEKLFDARLRVDDGDAPKSLSRAKSVAHGFSGTQIFSTTRSTKEIGEPNHCGIAGGASEWYAYQPTTNGTLYIDTDGSSFDTVLAIYTGPGDAFDTLVNVACDNDSGLDGKDSRVSFAATAGTIYWIAVDGVNNPDTGQPAKGSVALHYRLVLPLTLSATVYTNTSGGQMTFKVIGTPNLPATIETAMDAAAAWTPLITNSTASGMFYYTNHGVGGMPGRFYRAVNRF